MLNHTLIEKLNMKDPWIWLATWLGFGLMRKAPGTWGTLGGLPFGLLMLHFGGWLMLLTGVFIVFSAGYFAAQKFEQATGEHDAGAVVVDEVAGIWITLLFAPLSMTGAALAFILFRFFDILKPWPVSYFDRMGGAMGVMADDVMAGIYAALILGGLHYAGII